MNNKIIPGLILAVLIIGGVAVISSSLSKPQTTETNAMQNPTQSQVAARPTDLMAKSYTLDEVATHSTEADCWMTIEGKVYDVTSFIPNHPGGQAILKGCGKDATVLFEERPDTDKGPHPARAREQLDKLYIGELKK